MTCGIYCLYFECDDGQYYIGESSNIEKRYREHCNDLVGNRHDNYLLRKYYTTLGLPSISIVEITSSDNLKLREVHWIKEFDSFYNGMNLTKGGDGCGFGEDHPSSEYKKEAYVKVLNLLACTNKSAKEISEETKVSYNVVIQISIGKTHAYLKNEFPIEYAKMLAKVGTRKRGTVSNLSDYTLKTILDLLVYSAMSQKDIADQVKVPLHTVKSVCISTSHTDLKEKYPIEYELLLNKQSSSCYTKIKRPKLLSPEKQIFDVGTNVSLFCKNNGLDQRAISAVLLGTRPQHKGWKVYNELS